MSVFSAKDIEILISTMDRTHLDFLFKMFPNNEWKKVKILIINQSKKCILKSDFQNIKVINSDDFGLSKSRNLAIKNASGKLLYICDDDVVFQLNFIENILLGFQCISSDFICFRYENNGKLAKNYPKNPQENISWARLLSACSVEIMMKREIFLEKEIIFDTNFGIKSPFGMGEETIFLADYKNNGVKIGFFPKTIVAHNQPTTAAKISIETMYYRCGAIFYRIFGKKYWLWIFIKMMYDLKQRKINFGQFFSLLKEAQKGKKDFLTLKNSFSQS